MLALLLLSLIQTSPTAPTTPTTPATPAALARSAYEGVIHDRGKTIGTTILLDVSGKTVSGWIQKHDFVPIEGGTATESGYSFKAAGNTYEVNTRTNRIVYNGPDGAGNQRINRMDPILGRVYKITEETEEGRLVTLQTDHGEQQLTVERPPAIWKNNAPPIAKFNLERFEEVLGKTVTIWRVRTGGSWSVEAIEEPEGMNILPKLLKEKDKKKKK